MLVSTENIASVLATISKTKEIAIDCETTGLNSFKDDELFSIIISTANEDFYFNFKDYGDQSIEWLPKEHLERIAHAVGSPSKTVYMQNAKFDLHMLAKEGIFINGTIYDLQVIDRICFNQHQRYNLAEITKRWGNSKLDIVWDYITANKLITVTHHPRLGKTEEKPHFDRVPFSIIQPYGEQDGRATYSVGKKILSAIDNDDRELNENIPKQSRVIENESRLVHTLFRMEQAGVKCNIGYCNEALDYYNTILEQKEKEFLSLTGMEFVKGTTVFEEVFAGEKDKWEKTEKGNWKWDSDVLTNLEHPAAKVVVDWSEAKKQSEYFANFIFYADKNDVIHPSFMQSGTVTGRLSSRDPNFQNLSNPDKYEQDSDASLYPVRRAMVPRDGYFFAMIDYSQVEFRLMLDYANANSLITEVLKGHDVHTATATLAGISRKEAKTANFLTIYGGGVVKLAQSLYGLKGQRHQLGAIYKKMFGWRLTNEESAAEGSVTPELREYAEPIIRRAYDVQQSIFRAAPEIKDFIKTVQRTAEARGYVRNWFGRRYHFPDKRWCYKAPNHLIQGSAADVIKVAMNHVDEYLLDKESRMLLQIHDELVIEVKYGEEEVIPAIKEIMENIWVRRRLPLLVDVEYSKHNLADKELWVG